MSLPHDVSQLFLIGQPVCHPALLRIVVLDNEFVSDVVSLQHNAFHHLHPVSHNISFAEKWETADFIIFYAFFLAVERIIEDFCVILQRSSEQRHNRLYTPNHHLGKMEPICNKSVGA